ncbi:unnamed protein product [Brassica rapa]|uniref:Uncharacterized protein n=1 Tax=Brassica campestris TaxID=3711 RepID=A0A8D9M0R9_BRACM|nr:unnamed protein product [Brassica rapa]
MYIPYLTMEFAGSICSATSLLHMRRLGCYLWWKALLMPIRISCIHAIAAAKHIKRDENRFVDASHLTEMWAKAYAESIHPGGELSTSTYPENIDELSCPPPATKKKSGALLQRERDPLASLGFLDLNLSPTSAADVAQEGTTRSHARGL